MFSKCELLTPLSRKELHGECGFMAYQSKSSVFRHDGSGAPHGDFH